MLGILAEVILATLGIVFKWPVLLVISGVIQIWADLYNLSTQHTLVAAKYFPSAAINLVMIILQYIIGYMLGVGVIMGPDIGYLPAILGGITITGVIEEIIYMAISMRKALKP